MLWVLALLCVYSFGVTTFILMKREARLDEQQSWDRSVFQREKHKWEQEQIEALCDSTPTELLEETDVY